MTPSPHPLVTLPSGIPAHQAGAPDPRAAFCLRVAESAGRLALAGFRRRSAAELALKGAQDFLTETDGAVEAHLKAALAEHFPSDAFLGEETGGLPDAAALWVVDPIDGTSNFARGIAHFCIAIAFCQDGETRIGCIHAPASGETWFARRGHGATLNGAPIHASDLRDFPAAVLELGWNSRRPQAVYMAALKNLLDAGASVRRGGSGALGLAYVADGRSDGYAESHMNPWDCLAGLLIAEEAGARVSASGPAMLRDGGAVLAVAPGLASAVSRAAGIVLIPERSPNR